MMNVINVPASLDDQSIESVFDQLAVVPPSARILLDARNTKWASPSGLTGLLAVAQTRHERPQLFGPEDVDTASHWARSGFFRYAEDLFEIQGRVPSSSVVGESGTLLEITPLTCSDDVHAVVERVQMKASQIITQNLHLESRAVLGFSMLLSEMCQVVVERAGRGGWVAAQNFNYRKRMGRHVLQIGLCIAGMSIRDWPDAPGQQTITGPWDDGQALESIVFGGTSRFPEHGRGQGFKGMRGYLTKWQGKLAVRSGTSRIAAVPAWDDDLARRDGLAPFPGVLIAVMIPEKVER